MLVAEEAKKIKRMLTSVVKNESFMLTLKLKIVHFMRGGGKRKIECCMWRGMAIEEIDYIKYLDYTMERNNKRDRIFKKTQCRSKTATRRKIYCKLFLSENRKSFRKKLLRLLKPKAGKK